ncbi:MAG: M23 family metallopeptidase [Clostridia bacterium]|nr:M23 family metallopeptidase [Clostridia bacterium]
MQALGFGDNASAKQYDKGVLDVSDLSINQFVVPIVVTAADGKTIRTYNVVLVRDNSTYLMGKILTENIDGIHKSKVTVYKLGDPDEVISEEWTNDDGTYKIKVYTDGIDHPEMLDAKYEVVVTKKGYLRYTITGIILIPETDMDLGEYNLIAGDVIGAGEIEIDDLVWFNRKFGYYIDSEIDDSNKVYDFNEDGVVDQKDRDILVSNYGKIAEVAIWENPYEIQEMNLEDKEEFMLPVACNYTITSAYGTREDPITGEEKVHAGIDLRVEHHAEILSVYDGEVTFSGVQKGYGNCIEIKHIIDGEQIYSFYAHMSRLDVSVGETVKAGQVIGLEGGEPGEDENAGNSTGHHLHFEIRKTSSSSKNNSDPDDYLQF